MISTSLPLAVGSLMALDSTHQWKIKWNYSNGRARHRNSRNDVSGFDVKTPETEQAGTQTSGEGVTDTDRECHLRQMQRLLNAQTLLLSKENSI